MIRVGVSVTEAMLLGCYGKDENLDCHGVGRSGELECAGSGRTVCAAAWLCANALPSNPGKRRKSSARSMTAENYSDAESFGDTKASNRPPRREA
jgi:hypothetical protein